MSIRVLAPELVLQIAAGEVIERPASALKELMENSLDAGARVISVDLERGGIGMIRVCDDGSGIPPQELALALHPHASSKIRSAEDLTSIQTLGFRGEALASIAAVSQIRIASRVRGEEMGYELTTPNKTLEPLPRMHPLGTTVEAREVFFEIPARRRFLRSERTEFQHCLDCFRRLAIAHPDIRFRLHQDGKPVLDLDPAPDLESESQRLALLLGSEFIDSAIHLSGEHLGIHLSGWFIEPRHASSVAAPELWLVNGRIVQDRLLRHAVRQAYADVLYGQNRPRYVACLAILPAAVDVNVHPQKLEIKFRDAPSVHQGIVRLLRSAWQKGASGPSAIPMGAVLPPDTEAEARSDGRSGPGTVRDGRLDAGTSLAYLRDLATNVPLVDEPERLGFAVAEVGNAYIVSQSSQGLVVVDFHAAHERVLYEDLKQALQSRPLAAQTLLIPIPLSLGVQEIDVLLSLRDTLRELGYDLDATGPRSIQLRSHPVLLDASLAVLALEKLAQEPQDAKSVDSLIRVFQEVVADLGCQGAIHAGRRLTVAEMNALLRTLEKTPSGDFCNHGRPTWIRLEYAELDRRFRRGR
ncbi:MAG: DNA mismatch repair endonuclease MutL [Gammaproteobacteria bacterium]